MYSHNPLPFIAVLVPFLSGVLILLLGQRHHILRDSVTIIGSLVTFAIVSAMVKPTLGGEGTHFYFPLVTLPGIPLSLCVDKVGLLFATLSSFLWIITSIYSIGYLKGDSASAQSQTRYFFCFALAISATIGIAFSANLLTLLIFYEILTISTYPLVAHKQTPEAISAGRKYLVYTLTAGVLILIGIILRYPSVEFFPTRIPSDISKIDLYLLFGLFIIGFGVKSAFIPLHEWLPSAMVAPTPVSGLLHAVAVVKAGVFGCLRVILFIFGKNLLMDSGLWLMLACFVSVTIIISGMLALVQDNLKRRLAFSTINSLAVIILAVSILSSQTIQGGLFLIVSHAFSKLTLFFCAGAIYIVTHKENVSELAGVGRRMPWTMGAFAIASAGLVGLPLTVGFISKWWLCSGMITSGQYLFLAIVLLNSLVEVAIFFPIVYRAFFVSSGSEVAPNGELSQPLLLLPIITLSLMVILLGIFPSILGFGKLVLL